MVGNYQIQLGPDQHITGMASSDFTNDGSLGTSSTGLNPFVTPGVIYGIANSTDISTNVAGGIIASCEDSNAVSPNNRYFIDDASGAANYYSFNGSSVTKQVTGSATYIAGKSDLISFDTQFFATRASNLVKWNGTNTVNESYQSLSDSNAHHPLLVYQNFLWIGDGNTLATITANGSGTGTYTTAVLTLPSKEKIVALGIDPGTGLMMISVQTVYDVSDTIPSLKVVYLFDGISSKPTRKIIVDDLVTAFYNLEGQVYIGAGQTIGVWNGSGVTFLRKLKNVALINTDLPYKHHFTNIRNILMIIDGDQILSYGAVVSGKKAFYYTAYNPSGSGHLSIVMPVGSNKIAVAYATSKLSSFDFSSTSAGVPSLYYNNIYFPRPTFIRRVRIVTTAVTQTSASGIGSLTLFDEKNNSYTARRVTTAGNSTIGFYSPTATTTYEFDFDFTSLKCMGLQPRVNFDTQGFGIVRVYIYYDPAE